MKKATLLLIFAGLLTLSLTNCNKDDDNGSAAPAITTPVDGKILIGEGDAEAADVTVKLYADEDLFVGYNRLYVMLFRKGTSIQINQANIRFRPTMDMGTMTHRCPIENPQKMQPDQGVYQGAVVFIMESAGMGHWQMIVEVDNLDNEQSGEVAFDVEVKAKEEARLFSFLSEQDATPVFVSLVEPSDPEVGMNDFEITIHYRETKDNFPAMENITVSMEPEMPTMGHGSPDNVDPVYEGNGHYIGKVNFTMPGYWKVNLEFRDSAGNLMKSGQYFDITF